ncbi:Thiol:disulfide interchange protein DsbG precursor [Methylophaga frappieri]|uniref:Thiol:disulfide interchange protein n=1 Tax=Methylophaga frappieri (strain ATCC BAA-2434 / DSM 25690 / JAM7) TaxID=754477 RepID=I1YHV4_METFJ|nr:thiol:disulfide interchange protein DsbG [Methylophaga frappieri]AFJ02497.1 Thiol:disulfide interchange protein DsbG precursor [Methylophaga frappieri]
MLFGNRLIKIILLALVLAAVVGVVSYGLNYHSVSPQSDNALNYIEQQGVQIIGDFSTSAGLTGHVGTYQGEAMSIYTTPDGEFAIVGDLIDSQGNNLGADAIYELVSAPHNQRIWENVTKSAHWIKDGDASAPRIIYTFTDPYCPYCHRFRELAADHIDAGAVQLRHIIVGILQENSLAKAAQIMNSDSPESAWQRFLANKETQTSAILPLSDGTKGQQRVLANNALMEQLGLLTTPSTLYQDERGDIHLLEGLPTRTELHHLFQIDKQPISSSTN